MVQETVVGLDVHALSITVAILQGASDHPEVITLPADLMKVRRLFRRLATGGLVRSCYEASGAGFVLQCVLSDDGLSLRCDCAFTDSPQARRPAQDRPPGRC